MKCRRSTVTTSGDAETDRGPAERRPREVEHDATERHALRRHAGREAGRGEGRAQRDEGRRVVDERLPLEDGDEAPRADRSVARPRSRPPRPAVRRPRRSRRRPRSRARAPSAGRAPTPSAVKSTSPTDRLRMTPRLLRKSTSEVWIAAAYKQRRQDAEQHDLGAQGHLGDERQVGPEDPDEDENEGWRQVEPVGEPRPAEDGGRNREQADGDLHDAILPHGAWRRTGDPPPRGCCGRQAKKERTASMTRFWSVSVSSVAQGSERPRSKRPSPTAAAQHRCADKKGGCACSGRHSARAPTPVCLQVRRGSRRGPRPSDPGTSTE